MVVTASVVAQVGISTAAATLSTGSFTPTANSKLVAIALSINNDHTTAKSWTFSGGSLSWTTDETSSSFEHPQGANFDTMLATAWADVGSSPSSMTVTVDPYADGSTGYIGIIVYEVVGPAAGVSGRARGAAFDFDSGGTTVPNLGSGPAAGAVLLGAFFALSDGGAPTWNSTPTDWTSGGTTTTGVVACNGLYSSTDADGSVSHGYTSNQQAMAGAIVELVVGAAVVEQSHYRWGLDDGTESGHTWAAAEDTPLSAGTGQRRLLRVQLNESAGVDSTAAYTLQYKRSDEGDDQWRDL